MRSLLICSLLLAAAYRVGCDCGGEPAPDLMDEDGGRDDAGFDPDASVLDASVPDGSTDVDASSPDASSQTDAGIPTPLGTSLAVGTRHGCRVLTGIVSCFGENAGGQLGQGDTVAREAPTTVATDASYLELAAGSGTSCALDSEGAIFCWGANDAGQLGTGDFQPRLTPARVALGLRARQISNHDTHVCAIAEDGSLWCWGENAEGQMGFNEWPPAPNPNAPVRLGTFNDWTWVSVGDGHSCAIRGAGELYCWGRNTQFQLGMDAGTQLRVPRRVDTEVGYTDVACAVNHTCALRAGRLFCWGSVPEVLNGVARETPFELDVGRVHTAVAVHGFHACFIDDANRLFCWGRNAEGQLGVGDTSNRAAPTLVDGGAWARVALGRFSTCAQTIDGGTYCFGENASGQLGLGDFSRRNVPTRQP